MSYVLALDQGTTSSRALLFDREGGIKSIAQKEISQIFPQIGWVEHNPQEIWSSQSAVIAEALAVAGVDATEIAAIGITNQRETTVLWDRKTGIPLANAIVWQDRRTTPLCQKLKKEGLEPLFKQKTGLLLDPYFSATKIYWLLHEIPGALEKAKRGELAFGTIDSWLVWKLTEGEKHLTDASNASRTALYNIHTGDWDDELLALLDIPRSLLPEVRNSSEIYGKTSCSLFSSPIPIAGIAGDQQAALFGQGCLTPGMCKTTYGTGCFLLMNTGSEPVLSQNNLLTTIAYKIGGEVTYALEGSVFIGGAAVQWLRDNLGLIKTSDEIEKLARSVPDNGGVYFVPSFTGLGAPYWDPYARGSLLGLTRSTTAAHIARATLEGIAFQVMDVFKAMESDAKISLKELHVDGGAVKDNLLMQIQADLLRIEVLRPQMTELTALGAAYLAGLAVGIWKDKNDISQLWKLDRKFSPQLNHEHVKEKFGKWRQAIRCAQLWENKFDEPGKRS